MTDSTATHVIDLNGDILLVCNQPLTTSSDKAATEGSETDKDFEDAVPLDNITESMIDQPVGAGRTNSSKQPQVRTTTRFLVDSGVLRWCSSVIAKIMDEHVGDPGHENMPHLFTHIPLRGDDPTVMVLVLRTIHGQDPFDTAIKNDLKSQFPDLDGPHQQLNIEKLAEIAVVVDKYRLRGSLDHFLYRWIDKLWKQNIHTLSVEELVAWTWIAWVFDLQEYFEQITKSLAQKGRTTLQSTSGLKYPIPEDILRAIDDRRIDALTELYTLFASQMHSLFEDFVSKPISANLFLNKANDERASTIGHLSLYGARLGFWPEHKPNFEGTSYNDAKTLLLRCTQHSRHDNAWSSGRLDELSNFLGQSSTLLRCIEEREWGLNIGEFEELKKTTT